MELDSLCAYALSLKYVTEAFPFGDDTLVFKVGGKMFLLIGLEEYKSFNVKCDPDYAVELRDTYEGVLPGYHMNKKHWNTVLLHADVTIPLIKKMILHSYQLVYDALPQKIKIALEAQ